MGLGLLLLQSLYFFLPAYLANMAPELIKKVPILNYPVWERKLGKNKTWRGLVISGLVGILVFWIQQILYPFPLFYEISLIDYSDFSLLLGFLLGFGAILGDLVKSYFKRKNQIKPGDSWIPWDQLDFVIGGLILSWFLYVPKVEVVALIFLISPFLHLLFCRLGFHLKIKDKKY